MPPSQACPPSSKRAHVLLTGATGLVGGAVLADLTARHGAEVTCLVRGTEPAIGRARVVSSLSTWLDPASIDHAMRRVRIVLGDIACDGLGLDPRERAELAERSTHVVHCAASVRFDESLTDARAVNTAGAARALELAHDAHRAGSLERVVMVSTAFVSGTTPRCFSEHDLDCGQSFRTTYEQSKFEAELRAREAMARIPVTVVRPSIVVGHSRTGRTSAFNVLFAPLRLLLRAGMDVTLPTRADLPLDIVPVNWVARLAVEAMTHGEAGRTYAAASGTATLTMRDLADLTAEVFDAPVAGLLPAGTSDEVVRTLLTAWSRRLPSRARAVLGIYEPYLVDSAAFDSWRGDHLMWLAGVPRFDPRDVLRRSLEYARATDFGRARRSALTAA